MLLITLLVALGATVDRRLTAQNAAPENPPPAIPIVSLSGVPLPAAIANLAVHADLNYIIDPRVPGAGGPVSNERVPTVDVRWTNVTAMEALHRLMTNYNLVLVSNAATTIFRVARRQDNVKPLTSIHASTHGPAVPLIVMEFISLREAIEKLAGAAQLKIKFDPKPPSAAMNLERDVSFRWRNISAGQALAALLDNYGLALTEVANGSAQIMLKNN